MTFPLQITFEGGLAHSDALERRVQQEAAKLARFHDRIMSCRVAIVGRDHRRRHGDLYAVRLQIAAPGSADIVIDRNPPADHAHEDPFVAVRDAFAAARRRLQDRHRREQGKVKLHTEQPQGRIIKLAPDGDFGFLEAADGREIYFHRNAVLNGGYDKLRTGARVRYVETEGEKGPRASSVQPVGKATGL